MTSVSRDYRSRVSVRSGSAAHAKGDELVFIDPDKTLISGDAVQNKVGPYIYGEGGTAALDTPAGEP